MEERGDSRIPPTPTILVVDDEPNVVDLLRSYLESEGFVVYTANDGNAALALSRRERPDLVVLDVMLPGLDGVEVCRRLRHFSDAYVLMLTARSEESDKLVALAVGADDYLTKPFSPRELVARVKAMLRRPRHVAPAVDEAPPPLTLLNMVIDFQSRQVSIGGDHVHLTRREFDLLTLLAAHPGRVFTRSQLLERVWGDYFYDDHVVDVHINNLRKKLGDDPVVPRFVETVRGVGYRMRER